MKSFRLVLNIVFLLFTFFFLLGQTSTQEAAKIREENIDTNALKPKELFRFEKRSDATKGKSDFFTLVSDGVKYFLKRNTNIIREIEFPKEIIQDDKDDRRLWFCYLAMSKSGLDFISNGQFKKERNFRSDLNYKWLIFKGKFGNNNSAWFWNMEDVEVKKDITEWELIDLADDKFTDIFCNELKSEQKLINSQLNKLIEWGLKSQFSNFTIRAILPNGSLDSSQFIASQKKLDVIDLKHAFKLGNGSERPITLTNLNLSDTSVTLSYLIETNLGWYSWDGSKEIKGDDPLIKIPRPSVKEAIRLRKDPFFAWIRLAHPKANLVDDNDIFTYVNQSPPDIYAIKGNNLFQPIGIMNDTSEKADNLKKILAPLTDKIAYLNDNLIRNVITHWKNSNDLMKNDHYHISNVEKFGFTEDTSKKFKLLTLAFDNDANGCMYGWNIGEGPIELRCNFCPFLKHTSIMAGLGAATLRIISTLKVTDTTWRVATIECDNNTHNYNLLISEVDTILRKTTKVYEPLKFLEGTQINQDSVRNIYLRSLWRKLPSDRFNYPPDDKCESYWTADELDDFLKNNILGEKMKDIERQNLKIKQLMPDDDTYSNNDPNICLNGSPNSSENITPKSFEAKKFDADVSWRYLVHEGLGFFFYNADDIPMPIKWVDELNTKYQESAWLLWLALANQNVKVVTQGTECNTSFGIDSLIRIAFLLKPGGSLFSWEGNWRDSSTIPLKFQMIKEGTKMLLNNLTSTSAYLTSLYIKAIPEESFFYCEHLGKDNFTISDFFDWNDRYLGLKKTRFINLSHVSKADQNHTLTVLSDVPQIHKRNINFHILGKNVNSFWKYIGDIYSTENKNKFREIFKNEIATYWRVYATPKFDMFDIYWNSVHQYGISRKSTTRNQVGVFTNALTEISPNYRFGFRDYPKIENLCNSEFQYIIYNPIKAPSKENFFYSWVNDAYKIGDISGNPFWRANPLGYFDRIR